MKKLYIMMMLVLTGTMAAAQTSVWNGGRTVWTQGDGTEANPYLIESAENLAYLAYAVNKGYDMLGVHFLLITDIDLNGSEDQQWVPIGRGTRYGYSEDGCNRGNPSSPGSFYPFSFFKGQFDGGGHSISNIYIYNEEIRTNLGLFGCVRSESIEAPAIIKNLSVANGYINGSSYCGGIVGNTSGASGINTTYIYNCWSSVTLDCIGNSMYFGVGGIVGGSSGGTLHIQECHNIGEVSAFTAGGILGSGGAQIEECYNEGDITGTYAGGIYGNSMQSRVTINNCYNTGSITANSEHGEGPAYTPAGRVAAGGISCFHFQGKTAITNCYNVGAVSSTQNACCILAWGSTTTLENNYYISTCDAGGEGTAMSEDEMRTQAFVNLLNGANANPVWSMDTANVNNGFPVLIFPEEPFTITAIANFDEGGTVEGAGEFSYASTCTLTATANEGYRFYYWAENGEQVSTDANYTFTVTGNRNLVANFGLPLSITAIAIPEEGGSVSGTGEYDYNTTCTLTATANYGFLFTNWTLNGEEVSQSETYSFVVTEDANYVANFYELAMFEIAATPNPEEGGFVEGLGTYMETTICTLTATANEGYFFTSWSENGVMVSTEATYSFTVTGDRDLVANFQQSEFEILIFEPFEDYNVGNKIAAEAIAVGNNWWTTWSNAPGSSEDGFVVEYNDTQCGHLAYGNDQVLLLGDVDNGNYNLEFDILVPEGKNGYFNILHHFAGSNSTWAMECYLHMTADGQNSIQAPGHGTIHAGSNSTADVPCVYDAWMHFRLNVDTDNDIARYYYTAPGENEVLVCEWQWSLDSFGESYVGRTLAAMDFYPPYAATSEFYIDNFKLTSLSGETAPAFSITPDAVDVTLGEDEITSVEVVINNDGNSIGEWTGWIDFGQGGAGSQTAELYYHNGEVGSGIGSSNDCTREMAIRLPGNAYYGAAAGMKISSVNYYIHSDYKSADDHYTFRIYGQGFNDQPGELLAEKTIYSSELGTWITVTFDEDIYMTGQTIWASVELLQAADEYPLSMDEGEYGEVQDGNWISTNGGLFGHCYGLGSFEGAWMIGVNCEGELINGSWASLSKNEGTVMIGDTDVVNLTLNTIGIPEGTYNANLILNTNDVNSAHVEIPVTLHYGSGAAQITQTSNFVTGWTWWSSSIETTPETDVLGQLKDGLGASGQVIKSQTQSTMHLGNNWVGTLTMNNELGYMVKASSDVTVEITGTEAKPADHPITLNPGWTWIGYPNAETMTVAEALANHTPQANDVIKGQSASAMYMAGAWRGALTLTPGIGYMYKSNNNDIITLTYASPTRMTEAETDNIEVHWNANYSAYPTNMTVLAAVELDGEELNSADYELAAFANGECRGSVPMMYVEPLDRYMALLTLSGEEATSLHFGLYNTETGEEYFNADETLSFEADAVIGEVDAPFVIRFRNTTGVDEWTKSLQVYPNPVEHGQTITLGLSAEEMGEVQVEIINALGVVETVHATPLQTITAPNVAGIYTLKITVEGKGTCYRKLVVR